jgi:threonine/homoserine/homoserine lactone efflux protein
MQPATMLVFAATVLPLVCTPGPDILFIASQGMSGGPRAAMRANLGVLLGYSMHALLAVLGVAALVAASPVLFEILRWVGVAYLAYLATGLIRSAIRPAILDDLKSGILQGKDQIHRFLCEGTRRRPNHLVRWHRTGNI